MFRQRHQPGLRGLSDFTELKGVVVTIAGKLLAHKLYHFRLEWSHWSWMRVVLGGGASLLWLKVCRKPSDNWAECR